MNVLIVDDDHEDIGFYEEMIEDIDSALNAQLCLDPRTAFTHLKEATRMPDVIILDFNMPVMTGLDFLQILRADPSLKHLRVEVVSTGCSPTDIEALRVLGADCYKKPNSYSEFKALLQSLIA